MEDTKRGCFRDVACDPKQTTQTLFLGNVNLEWRHSKEITRAESTNGRALISCPGDGASEVTGLSLNSS